MDSFPRRRSLRVPRRVRAVLVLIPLLVPTGSASGQPPLDPPRAASRPEGSLVGTVTAGVVLGLGAAALMTREWQGEADIIRAVDPSPLDPAMGVANTYGNGLVLGGTAVGLLALGAIGRDPGAASLGRELTMSLALAWTATWGLKFAVHSDRPNGGAYSFPSGHTATAFAAAPVFAAHYGTPGAVAAYTLAGLTALARIEDEKHYAADVLAGAAIGILAGRFSLRLAGDRVSVDPLPAGAGLSVRF